MTSQQLKEIIEEAGYETMSYSGRGMYGKNCIAVKFDPAEGSAISITANIMASVDDTDQRDELVKMFKYCASDSFGLDQILYFHRMEWVE